MCHILGTTKKTGGGELPKQTKTLCHIPNCTTKGRLECSGMCIRHCQAMMSIFLKIDDNDDDNDDDTDMEKEEEDQQWYKVKTNAN